ncbi:AKAP6 [Cervus elaphus hippelaphus]|uniref:AKAP6 n=1 Tax=Cervus elaphus hippelaphus TaxID=46360 RepID=A0A212CSJ0_CEREH|nr:AKAP6 [Cervus elaphus hippelaphus]
MSFPGQLSLDIASSINEDSPASLTELSSSDELSLCSEDIVLHKNKIPESNASFRKRLPRSVADESDVNVSMIVNVSCTSACTDDEDDSDLLSSSTLTLTEEELCIKDEDDDSSIATDDEIYEDCNVMSGLDYIKNELQTWIRPKLPLTRDKRRCNLSDEIKGTKDVSSSEMTNSSDTLNIEALLNGSIKHLSENNGNTREQNETEENVAASDNVACCDCEPDIFHQKDAEDCSVHDFVKEIIDMASTALKCKSQPENEVTAPTSLTQIKEKVLEHSHRPIQLRKGDFYSYLSLSSHDSDCGEVTNYIEEKSSTPLPPDMTDSGSEDKEDAEYFFEACVEEDPAEDKPHFSDAPPNEPADPTEAAVPLPAAAGSSRFSDTSFLTNNADTVALSSPPKGGKPGCSSRAASPSLPGLVSGSIVSLPFVTLTSPQMNLSSECGCPHEPCDLDVHWFSLGDCL